MSIPEDQLKPQRFFRDCKVVFVRQIDDDHFLVTDKEGKNEYSITKETLDREYKILY